MYIPQWEIQNFLCQFRRYTFIIGERLKWRRYIERHVHTTVGYTLMTYVILFTWACCEFHAAVYAIFCLQWQPD